MITVLKTNIQEAETIATAQTLINKLLPNAVWSIDTEDCDHVLRIDYATDVSAVLIKALQVAGIDCEEMM